MSVLIEGISVVLRRDAITRAFGPQWKDFVRVVPNKTLCADAELARVGFMDPRDVKSYVSVLEERGLRYLDDGKAVDLIVVDQLRGPAVPCDWLEVGMVEVGGHKVAAARRAGSSITELRTPEGWSYERSLTAKFGFTSQGAVDTELEKIGFDDTHDIYRDRETGKEVYVERTEKPKRPASAKGPGKEGVKGPATGSLLVDLMKQGLKKPE